MSKFSLNTPCLAFVIPAYKPVYLRETLSALVNQTNRNFSVYIGDDGSPFDLSSIVNEFSNDLCIVYRRFEENLGGRDLVAHWRRCIDLVEDEKWVWFFSDDDLLDAGCVEAFYREVSIDPHVDVFHFNVKVIDGDGDRVGDVKFPNFPEKYQAMDFCRDRLCCLQQSYMVEFVFRLAHFKSVGGFENFDLAWGSDVATCIKLAHPRGIRTIKDNYVYWRRSSHNISPNNSKDMVVRKLSAVVDFFVWLNKFCEVTSLSVEVSPFYIYGRRWLSFRGRNGIKKTFQDIGRLVRI